MTSDGETLNRIFLIIEEFKYNSGLIFEQRFVRLISIDRYTVTEHGCI